MKIAVCITNHDQNDLVLKTIKKLDRQSRKPDEIIVCCDGDTEFELDREDVVVIRSEKGRCANRNTGARAFLEGECDRVLFIDGDCAPAKTDFVQKMADHLDEYDLVFGTRRHELPQKKLKMPPSDLLTVNMDNMWSGKKTDLTDLRVASGAVDAWNSANSFEERLDLMLTGMIGWSCNFGFTRKGLERMMSFMADRHGKKELFDTEAFDGSWGYEDVAMGIDALYAGLDIGIFDDVRVSHSAHDRTDGLFDHVKGRHLVMQRARELDKSVKVKDRAYIAMLLLFFLYIAGVITGLITGYISIASSFAGN